MRLRQILRQIERDSDGPRHDHGPLWIFAAQLGIDAVAGRSHHPRPASAIRRLRFTISCCEHGARAKPFILTRSAADILTRDHRRWTAAMKSAEIGQTRNTR